ncbi:MAG: hypothetical protein QOJ63_2540 [Solirubrobacteraceae bacterium]|nr:hypothetical protein [Solirubrobacteraceae bacterium]
MSEPASTAAWLAANPPPDAAFRQSLAGVARRALAGESFDLAARELLDELALLQSDAQRTRALAEEPPLTGDPRHDAYLGALGEHFALRFDIDRPQWVTRPERFLDRFWFKSGVPGFRAIAIAQSPAAFRRRGIFIAAGALERC